MPPWISFSRCHAYTRMPTHCSGSKHAHAVAVLTPMQTLHSCVRALHGLRIMLPGCKVVLLHSVPGTAGRPTMPHRNCSSDMVMLLCSSPHHHCGCLAPDSPRLCAPLTPSVHPSTTPPLQPTPTPDPSGQPNNSTPNPTCCVQPTPNPTVQPTPTLPTSPHPPRHPHHPQPPFQSLPSARQTLLPSTTWLQACPRPSPPPRLSPTQTPAATRCRSRPPCSPPWPRLCRSLPTPPQRSQSPWASAWQAMACKCPAWSASYASLLPLLSKACCGYCACFRLMSCMWSMIRGLHSMLHACQTILRAVCAPCHGACGKL